MTSGYAPNHRRASELHPTTRFVITLQQAWRKYEGVYRDANVLSSALSATGHRATVLELPKSRVNKFIRRLMISRKSRHLGTRWLAMTLLRGWSGLRRHLRRTPRPVAVFLEHTFPGQLTNGALNILVPNPEGFTDRRAWELRFVDLVLCKTRDAVPTFTAAGCRAEYLGFSSEDIHTPGIVSDRSRWVHVASNDSQKGTREVIEAWHSNPLWPQLTIVAGGYERPIAPSDNLHVVNDWLDERAFRALLQSCGVHLCPSNAEGFGHTIVEAMSCGVLVITTDLAPMNELVDESRGLLIDVAESTPAGWSRRARIDQAALAKAVERAVDLSDLEYHRRAAAARRWYEDNDAAFKERLMFVAANLASK